MTREPLKVTKDFKQELGRELQRIFAGLDVVIYIRQTKKKVTVSIYDAMGEPLEISKNAETLLCIKGKDIYDVSI